MKKNGVWKIHPVKNEIILTLVRHRGEMLDTDLLRELQRVYPDINRNILNKILFVLEVEMIIQVTRMKKNQNRVAIRPNAPINDDIKELFANA